MSYDYELEREKLYSVLYEQDKQQEETEESNNSFSANATGSSIDLLSLMVVMISFFYILSIPNRLIDWFERGGC